MQIVKRASLLVLVVFAQGLWVTDAAAYSSGMNSDLAGQSVHGFNGSGFATGDPVSGSTTTCAASGCHTGSAFPDGDVVLDWTNGAGGGEPTIIPPGVPTNFGVRLQNGNTSVGAIGFNATARKNGSHDRFGTFVVSTPVQVWDEITKPPSGIIQGGHAGPKSGILRRRRGLTSSPGLLPPTSMRILNFTPALTRLVSPTPLMVSLTMARRCAGPAALRSPTITPRPIMKVAVC